MAILEPQPGAIITLDDKYQFMPHPSVPSMVFAQEGRKAVVYQLSKNGRKFALKIFKPKYRDVSIEDISQNISKLSFRGLEACTRTCFTRSSYARVISTYPDMEYAVLMPWVDGSTWFDVVYQGASLTQDSCKKIAKSAADVLANLENQNYAHCDIAGANVIVNTLNGEVSFIDLEDMFGPGLSDPTAYPLGVDGYQHHEARTRVKGQWCAAGDRFSAAILFGEMLGWSNDEVRNCRDEEHYFSPQEMQGPSSHRYLLLLDTLKSFSQTIADFFERAWTSTKLEDCPTLTEWAKALEFPIVTQWIPIEAPPPAASYKVMWGEPIVVSPRDPIAFMPNNTFVDISVPPEIPKFFRMTSLTSLAWLPSFSADGYLVEESDDPVFTQPTEYYRGAQTECVIKADNKPKYYRIRSFNQAGNSSWSSVIVLSPQAQSDKKEVFFTAYHPKEGIIESWHTLLVYTHVVSALIKVREDAIKFEDQIKAPKETTSRSSTPVTRGTELTIIPTSDGVQFNPEHISFRWTEDFHRADFRFKADQSLSGDATKGQITIYAGPLIIGTLKFAMLFNDQESQTVTEHEEHAKMYGRDDVFISYSRKDTEIARIFKTILEATGMDVFLDVDDLRSGQLWQDELLRRIERVYIFQMFWSENYSQSENCRMEWEYALKQNKGEGFIRPVYWKSPLSPKPPEELNKFNFQYVDLKTVTAE